MTAYGIRYTVNGKKYDSTVEAKDLASAKKKLGRKHGYKSGRMIQVKEVAVIGYF